MKVLAVNPNYSKPNKDYKKKDVNFEAVRVDADAIEAFRKTAPATSLSRQLMIWANKQFGTKVIELVRYITGVQEGVSLEKIFNKDTGLCQDLSQIKHDIFVHYEYGEGEYGRLISAINEAREEAFVQTPLRDDKDAYRPLDKFKLPEEQQARAKLAVQIIVEQQVKVFDQLWDEEGTACNKLQNLVRGFVEEANSDGHYVSKEDIVPFATELEANEKTAEEAKEAIDEAKEIADKAVTDRMIAKWFPKPVAEINPAVKS